MGIKDQIEAIKKSANEVKEDSVKSCPPSQHLKVTNIYVNKDTGKLVVEYEDTPQP